MPRARNAARKGGASVLGGPRTTGGTTGLTVTTGRFLYDLAPRIPPQIFTAETQRTQIDPVQKAITRYAESFFGLQRFCSSTDWIYGGKRTTGPPDYVDFLAPETFLF
jgi:hypothetical protein